MSKPEDQPPTAEHIENAEAEILDQSKRIEFYLTEYSVELLAKKMDEGEFEIPAYQREDTWEHDRKSRFVESLLMGLPIPFLFFWEQPTTGLLEVVDGSQRLRTIQQFLAGTLKIGPLEQLTWLEGLKFTDLSESRQRKIKNRSIRGIVLNEHADAQARFDLFERINTGSKIANEAEIRRGALTGPFLDLVIELAKHPLFIKLAPVGTMSVNLREREELITRLFAYGDGLEGYKDRPAKFLFSYVKKMNEMLTENPSAAKKYRKRFLEVMTFIDNVFPFGFRKSASSKQTPRTRFEAIAIGTSLALSESPSLKSKRPSIDGWFDSEEFLTLTKSGGANPIASLQGRLHYVRDRLLEAQK